MVCGIFYASLRRARDCDFSVVFFQVELVFLDYSVYAFSLCFVKGAVHGELVIVWFS